eukprot:2645116-Rhodomonas_salina.1
MAHTTTQNFPSFRALQNVVVGLMPRGGMWLWVSKIQEWGTRVLVLIRSTFGILEFDVPNQYSNLYCFNDCVTKVQFRLRTRNSYPETIVAKEIPTGSTATSRVHPYSF